jgi:hypothetical protein
VTASGKEEFEILQVTPGELEARIRTGVIRDGMTIAAWSIATLSGGYGKQAGNKTGRSQNPAR